MSNSSVSAVGISGTEVQVELKSMQSSQEKTPEELKEIALDDLEALTLSLKEEMATAAEICGDSFKCPFWMEWCSKDNLVLEEYAMAHSKIQALTAIAKSSACQMVTDSIKKINLTLRIIVMIKIRMLMTNLKDKKEFNESVDRVYAYCMPCDPAVRRNIKSQLTNAYFKDRPELYGLKSQKKKRCIMRAGFYNNDFTCVFHL